MSSHTLTERDIMSIPQGRIMNTFIQEYILNEHPSRWSNGQQKEILCHWFEEHPRACAEDDGGYCSADSLANFSGDVSRALSLINSPVLKGKTLSTKTESDGTYWATFGTIPFEQKNCYTRSGWAPAETMALAICRAALLV